MRRRKVPPEAELLKGLVRAARSALDLQQMLNLVLDLLIGSVKAEVGVVFLRHGERFVPRAGLGLTEKALREVEVEGRPLLEVLLEQDAVFVWNGNAGADGRLRSLIAAPLVNGGEKRGLIVLANREVSTGSSVFGPEDAAALRLLADDLAVIVDNALLYEEVSHLKSYNESILDSLPNGIITTDLEGTVVTVNKGAEYILGVEASACVGQNVAVLFRRVLKSDFDILRVVKSGENLIDYEVNLEKEDGRILVLGVSVSALRNGRDGRTIGAAIHISDFTQRKILEGQMARAEQLAALGEMSAGVAHEIRNPLTSIQGFTQLLPKRKDDPKFLEKYVEIVTRETARLNGIVERFLTFARPRQAGFQECHVNEVVQNALSLLHYQVEKGGVALDLRMAETPPVRGDWQQLEQVFINILLNAVQMMDKPEKRLSVSTAVLLRKLMDNRYREFVAVRIADNGPGIPPERLERIFQPFYTTRPEGTGLGLSITSQIVERHDGSIEVQSKPGEGTVFTVYLPAVEPQEEVR